MIRTACLIKLNDAKDELLLVRVRDNLKWYLPGGKIEANESTEETLIRELKEELNVNLITSSIKFQTSIRSIAYGIDDIVELNCFTADFMEDIQPCAEISEARFVNWKKETEILAPAIIKLGTTFLDFI